MAVSKKSKKKKKKELADFEEKKNKKIEAYKKGLADFGEEGDRKEKIDYEEDEGKFICKICGKEYSTRNQLDDHMEEHY